VDWKEIHAEAWRRMRQAGFLEWKRVSTSVVVPLMVGLIQWQVGVSLPINIAITLSSGLLLYGLLILIERWVRIREVIAERIDANASAIQKLDQRIAELESPRFDLKVVNMTVSSAMPTSPRYLTLRLDLQVKTGAEPVTLHGWGLRAARNPDLEARLQSVHSTVGSQALSSRNVRIDSKDVAQIALTFGVSGKTKEGYDQAMVEWSLDFEDATQAHSMQIPERLSLKS